MKSCPVCGLAQDEECLFCPEDGSALSKGLPESVPEEKQVLYCPACAAEYPLTFKVCPIHIVPLTKHNLLKSVAPVYRSEMGEKRSVVQHTTNSLETKEPQKDLDIRNPSPQITPIHKIANTPDLNSGSKTESENEVSFRDMPPDTALEIDPPDYLSGYVALANADHDSTLQSRSHRIAAIVLVIGLSLFGVAALYTFYKNVSAKSAMPGAKIATQEKSAVQQTATVYTPQAALDYKEENPEPLQPKSEASLDDTAVENERPRRDVALPSIAQSRRGEIEEQKPAPPVRQQQSNTVAAPVSAPAPAGARELVLPRGTYGQVDARLLNVRSRKTPNGFRYDLTFNLQEQAGRTTQWERLAIVTRSASGVSHTQAMPFYHRLGASGTLTFTVSVEMQGRAQPDWAGRIICTSIGTDQTGKAYRASFGANVSP
ncbi:MAG: hypothetical protein WBV94_00590 [Blastocatellia bacterium]